MRSNFSREHTKIANNNITNNNLEAAKKATKIQTNKRTKRQLRVELTPSTSQ